MILFGILFAVALVFSAIGFKQYIWFISIGYGFSIAAIGVALLVAAGLGGHMDVGIAIACLLFVAYGCRLGGYLAYREMKNGTYAEKMRGEIKSGDQVSMAVKCAIWVSASLLYAAQTAPVAFRVSSAAGTDAVFVVGLVISAIGLCMETLADLQKNAAKKVNPHRFVDTGLYRIVRCPNYFGELLFWTGTFVGGIPIYHGVLEWIVVLLGYLGIIYVMFSGARRLEIRQNRVYGDDPEYQRYVSTTPIMIPLIPIYSVEKHKWLVA